jgi:hypothetical protein
VFSADAQTTEMVLRAKGDNGPLVQERGTDPANEGLAGTDKRGGCKAKTVWTLTRI